MMWEEEAANSGWVEREGLGKRLLIQSASKN